MTDIKSVLNKYIQESTNFITYIENIISDVEMKTTQIEHDREQIIKERADIIAKSKFGLSSHIRLKHKK